MVEFVLPVRSDTAQDRKSAKQGIEALYLSNLVRRVIGAVARLRTRGQLMELRYLAEGHAKGKIVINASPIILLHKADIEFLLPALFSSIIVPEGVMKEISVPHSPSCVG